MGIALKPARVQVSSDSQVRSRVGGALPRALQEDDQEHVSGKKEAIHDRTHPLSRSSVSVEHVRTNWFLLWLADLGVRHLRRYCTHLSGRGGEAWEVL